MPDAQVSPESGLVRTRRALTFASLLLVGLALVPAVAQAGTAAGGGPTFPSTVTVGQTGVPATIDVRNNNSPPNDEDTNVVCNSGDAFPCPVGEPGMTLIPSCGQLGAFSACTASGADPGVFQLSSTGVGQAGTACGGVTFNITVIDPVFGQVRFTPLPSGTNVALLGTTSMCRIGFTFDVLKTPTVDQNPVIAGVQTVQIADNTQRNGGITASARGTSNGTTVLRAAPTIATTASPNITLGAGTLTDTATLSGRVGPQPGATVTFTLYGPNDSTCTGAPAFAPAPVAYPVAGGPVTSPGFTPTQAGTFRWRASYSGDTNNAPVSTACNDANETTSVAPANPTIATNASPAITLGAGTLTDAATVSGRANPQAGGTITFTLYAPGDNTCTSTPAFTATPVAYPVAGGPVTSPGFTPTQAGTFRWRASYSGDTNNAPVSTACNDANETTSVAPANPTIATSASPDIVLGAGTLTDSATVSGRSNPLAGATITFKLYGPNDATCAGTPAFSPAAVSYPIAGGPVTSPAFTPTQAGTYRWTADYSGDANNTPVSGPCNAANATTVVNKASPTIATNASPDIVLGAGTLTDDATVSGRSNPLAGATITFKLYGPNDATCAGAPAFSPAAVTYPVAGGPVTSPPFTPTQAGTYRWTADYSGDANNTPVSGPCNAANATTVVAKATPSVATTASPNITLGAGTLTDAATVSGRSNPQPGATITFRLYGPNDPTCTGTPIFSPAAVSYPVAGGPVTSPPFTPTQAGSYRWTADYSGDANNTPVNGPCVTANATGVAAAIPTIATSASAGIVVAHGTLTDRAVVSGRVHPLAGATIAFRLYGPQNATCSGTPVFSSLNRPYPVAGGVVSSAAFAPTLAGTYRWRAVYSGDANNAPVSGACNAATENTLVSPAATPPPVRRGCLGRTVTIYPKLGQTVIVGTSGPDVILGRDASEKIDSRGGDDVICAGKGNDKVHGGSGDDIIVGGDGSDQLFGDSGDDLLLGRKGDDILHGGSGNDHSGGGDGRDRVYGDSGNDVLDEQHLGGRGTDRLFGGSGRDVIRTAGGTPDSIDCGPGVDSVFLDLTDRKKRCERIHYVKSRASVSAFQ